MKINNIDERICLVAYTYRGFSTEELFIKAKKYGYKAIEYRDDLRDADFSTSEKLKKSIKYALKLSKKYKISIPTIFFRRTLIEKNLKKRKKNLKELIEAIDICEGEGISILNTQAGTVVNPKAPDNPGKNGSIIADKDDYRAAIECFSIIGEYIKNKNILIAIETHHNTIHDTARTTFEIIKKTGSPQIKVCLDFANIYLTPHAESVERSIKILKNDIIYTHIKNVIVSRNSYDFSVSLENGELSYRKILRLLQEIKYSGYYAIEYCGENNPDFFAKQDIKYLKRLLSEL